MKTENKKVRKIKPGTAGWEKMANSLARSYCLIKACRDCGYPVVVGYCCSVCGSVNP